MSFRSVFTCVWVLPFLGCGGEYYYRDFEPPAIYWWNKEGADKATIEKDANECVQEEKDLAKPGAIDSYKLREACMLRKGYCFTNVRRSSRWINYCEDRPDGPACKSLGKRECPPPLMTPEQFWENSIKFNPSTDPDLDRKNAIAAKELVRKRFSGEIPGPGNASESSVPAKSEGSSSATDESQQLNKQSNEVQKSNNSQMNQLLRAIQLK